VEIGANIADAAFLQSFSTDALAEFFNVSQVVIRPSTAVNEDGTPARPAAVACPATGTKCNRCWRYTDDTSDYGAWHNVCARCRGALKEMGINPPQPEAKK
jgi:isoleucyl-tRNA synthetase